MALDTPIDVVVVGAGVAGLVATAVLTRGGVRVRILERRKGANVGEDGADLALWPGAVTILKALGVPDSFFERSCYTLHTVHMCNMDFANDVPVADVMTTINMRTVTEESGESFALVSRTALMEQLRKLVDPSLVSYGVVVTAVNGSVVHCVDGTTITPRVVLGCDGARSVVRSTYVVPDALPPRFAGEICYRGVLPVDDTLRKFLADTPDSRVMRINYGAGLRSSFGYMSGDGSVAYWWVKVPATDAQQTVDITQWPVPLRALYDATPPEMRYVHDVEDASELKTWSRGCVALVGDAAHLVTPNMGQGACMAVEDAFVLGTLLLSGWKKESLEGTFAYYESVRKPYANMVAAEASKQLIIGQLKWWPLVWLRNLLLRNIPSKILEGKLKANCFDVTRFIELFSSLRENAN